MARRELQLLRGDMVVRVIPVDDEPVSVGRDLSNTVSLLDDDVSTHHAVVSRTNDGLEVRDLRSTNGTFVNDVRIDERSALADGDVLQLGAGARFRVSLTGTSDRPTLILQHETAGMAHLLDDERYRIGSGAQCNLILPAGPEVAGTLIAHANGEVWLGTDEDERAIEPGERFEIHGHTFRIERAPTSTPSTVWGCREAKYGYQLRVGVEGTRVQARLLDPSTGTEHRVKAENRAVLLYTLARKLREELDQGRAPSEAGWTDDEDVLIAVWGRAGFQNAGSTYSVLLHRLRKEIESAGFDPWFIEKRRGGLRLRLRRVEVQDQP